MKCQWCVNRGYSNSNDTQLRQTWRVKLRTRCGLYFQHFLLSEAESKNLSVISRKFDAYFAQKMDIMYERYLFNHITQAEGQPFDDFLTSVVNQGTKYEFGELYDSLLHNKIVVGVCSDMISAVRGDTLPSVHAMHISHNKTSFESQDTEFKTRNKCPKCSYNHPQRMCPADGKECKKCGKIGHFAKLCPSKQILTVNSGQQCRTTEPSSSGTFFVSSIDIHHNHLDWIEKLKLPNGNSGSFKLDTGVQCNVLSCLTTHRALIIITPSKKKDSIPVLGEADVKVFTNKNTPHFVTILIVDKGHQCILGRETCKNLGNIKHIETAIFDGEVFDGIGCLKGLAMVQSDIIEPITEPTLAVSPMVVVYKNGKMRICIDTSDINKNLKRRYYPLQTIEEISARLKGSKYFTLLDCNKGFWQIKVTDRKSQYLTFVTPWGRYKCNQMPFGLASAPEVFQQIMCHTLHGIKRAECSMDDILLHAESINELYAIPQTVMKQLA
ncbi:hypothetical protein PR048_012128 [Dryococelus australis]|uniref:CCHC-type domain-containing protein n=1 Tax=Dryococelus australis TaxID=614101 RepID=A0ABQ9HNV3_9NEOP|nr:hypothetical protein PR048_012128 [Dryococelus australis]